MNEISKNNPDVMNHSNHFQTDEKVTDKILIKFQSELKKMNIFLTENQVHQFLQYYNLLNEWNKVMNLTAITEFEEVVEKHFIDSLCLVKFDSNLSGRKILDLGTGAGFPGIPLKITFPDADIVLMDSLNKRIKFLNEVIQTLNLNNIAAVHGRAEDMAHKKEYRQQFDFCVSRAVSNLSVLSEYCLPFVKVKGFFISYKSAEISYELNTAERAIRDLGGRVERVITYSLPDSNSGRSLVCIKKDKGTSRMYPRKAGIPAKKPIQ